MQIEQRKVASRTGRNVTVTFYKLRANVKSGMLYRAEMRGELPIFVYKIKGSTKVEAMIPGVSSRIYRDAKRAFVSLSTRYWGLGA